MALLNINRGGINGECNKNTYQRIAFVIEFSFITEVWKF